MPCKIPLQKFQMLFEQNVASIWQLETRKTEIFEQKTGISVEIFWFEIEIELHRTRNQICNRNRTQNQTRNRKQTRN